MKILSYVLLSFVLASINFSSANANRLESPANSIVAQIQFEKGKLTFIDESIAGIFGFGILEEGAVTLTPLYEQEATPLEIFLAYAPQGTRVPEVLYRAHDHYREQNPAIPEKPRKFKQSSAQVSEYYYKLKKDTDNCWGWGNVNQYDDLVGNEPGTYNGHESSAAVESFKDWSQIPPGAMMTTSHGYFFEENAEQSDQYYSTGYANQRAFAMCVTHTLVQPQESQFECDVDNGAYANDVKYRLKFQVWQAGGDTWSSDNIFLEGYGEGARYRSSSNVSRKYELRVVDLSKNSLICKERYDVFWRSRKNPSPAPASETLAND